MTLRQVTHVMCSTNAQDTRDVIWVSEYILNRT